MHGSDGAGKSPYLLNLQSIANTINLESFLGLQNLEHLQLLGATWNIWTTSQAMVFWEFAYMVSQTFQYLCFRTPFGLHNPGMRTISWNNLEYSDHLQKTFTHYSEFQKIGKDFTSHPDAEIEQIVLPNVYVLLRMEPLGVPSAARSLHVHHPLHHFHHLHDDDDDADDDDYDDDDDFQISSSFPAPLNLSNVPFS